MKPYADLAVWWLSPLDFEALGEQLPVTLPEWLRSLYCEARWRAGRGRLWVAPELKLPPGMKLEEPTGLDSPAYILRYVERCCGLVVLARTAVAICQLNLPGLITGPDYRRFVQFVEIL